MKLLNIESHPAIKLGQFIKDQRIGAGYTLSEAAKKIGMKPSALSELEKGIGDNLSLKDNTSNHALYWKMVLVLEIDDEQYKLEHICNLFAENDVKILKISDIFDEEDVLPAFIPLTEKQREKFLKVLGFRD